MNTIQKLPLIAKRSHTDRGTRFSSLAYLIDSDMLTNCYSELKRAEATELMA